VIFSSPSLAHSTENVVDIKMYLNIGAFVCGDSIVRGSGFVG
jgi:hypothetical protein